MSKQSEVSSDDYSCRRFKRFYSETNLLQNYNALQNSNQMRTEKESKMMLFQKRTAKRFYMNNSKKQYSNKIFESVIKIYSAE